MFLIVLVNHMQRGRRVREDPRPPHPGARPDVPSFPHAESLAASRAIEAMVEQLEQVVRALGTAVGDLEGSPFEGVFADHHLDDNDSRRAALEAQVTVLEGHLDDLERLRIVARADIDAAEAAAARWRSRNAAWHNWHARNQLTAPQ